MAKHRLTQPLVVFKTRFIEVFADVSLSDVDWIRDNPGLAGYRC